MTQNNHFCPTALMKTQCVVPILSVTDLEFSANSTDDKGMQRLLHGNSLHCCKDFRKKEQVDLVSMSLLKGPEEGVVNIRGDWLDV